MAAATRARSSCAASCSALPRTSASPTSWRSRCRRSNVAAARADSTSWASRRAAAADCSTCVPSTAAVAAARAAVVAASSVAASSVRRRASSSADAVAPAPPRPRRKPVAENRSPLRVTTTADGWARATSKASAHGPATTTACWSSRSSRPSTVGSTARTWSRTRAPGVAAAGAGGRPGRGEDAAAHVHLVEVVEGAPRRPGVGDDHRGERLAQRGLGRRLPAGIDLDQVEQRAERAVDVAQVLGAGPGAGGVERQGEGIGPGAPLRVPFGRGRPRRARVLGGRQRRDVRDLCGFERGQERRLGLLGLREPGSRGLGGLVERGVPFAQRRQRGLGPGQPLLVGLVGAAPSVELAPHLGRGPRRPGGVGPTGRAVVGAGAAGQVVVGRRGAARGGRLLVRLQGGDVRLQARPAPRPPPPARTAVAPPRPRGWRRRSRPSAAPGRAPGCGGARGARP